VGRAIPANADVRPGTVALPVTLARGVAQPRAVTDRRANRGAHARADPGAGHTHAVAHPVTDAVAHRASDTHAVAHRGVVAPAPTGTRATPDLQLDDGGAVTPLAAFARAPAAYERMAAEQVTQCITQCA
jgi:hypothetical protein